MSIEDLRQAFGPCFDPPEIRQLVDEVLAGVFSPDDAFVLPKEGNTFELEKSGGSPLADVLTEVQRKVVAAAIHSRHPWAIAHMCPPPLTASVIADLLIGAMNQCAFIWEEAPVASAIETACLRWLSARLGFNGVASGLITSGGTMSNCIATHLARVRARRSRIVDMSQLCIVASDQAHVSIRKAAAFIGLPSDAVCWIPTDGRGRLQPGMVEETTQRACHAGKIPFLFICTAGTTNAGILEPVDEFLAASRKIGAWCHVDAAHGGLMSLSRGSGEHSARWAEADSVSWDPHKSLYVSYALGCLILRDGEKELAPLDFRCEYALKGESSCDPGRFHLDGSRRFDALKLWMVIKYLGESGLSDLVNYSLFLTSKLAANIRALHDFSLITSPDTNIVVFRFNPAGCTARLLDNLNLRIQKRLFSKGGPLISSTVMGGRTVLRAVIQNPFLEPRHLGAILEEIRKVGLHELNSNNWVHPEAQNEDRFGYQPSS